MSAPCARSARRTPSGSCVSEAGRGGVAGGQPPCGRLAHRGAGPEGRRLTISIGFVDTHVHFWDHSVEGLEWAWLDPDFQHPRIRSLAPYDAPRYASQELRSEAEGADVVKVVHVQAATGRSAPEVESAWLERLGEQEGWPDAVIAGCRLHEDGIGALLDRHAAFSRYRGVRDQTVQGHLSSPASVAAAQQLSQSKAVLEVMVSKEHFPGVARLARAYPGLTVILEHAGLPIERTAAYHQEWREALRLVAEVPTTICKISALAGSVDPQWSAGSLRPWVEACVETFGPERCMFGSNWPIDKPYGRYVTLISTYRELVSDLSEDEQYAVLRGVAERVYQI